MVTYREWQGMDFGYSESVFPLYLSLDSKHVFMYFLYNGIKIFLKCVIFLLKFFPQHKSYSLGVINLTILTCTCSISFITLRDSIKLRGSLDSQCRELEHVDKETLMRLSHELTPSEDTKQVCQK